MHKDIHILEKVQRRTGRCVTNNYTDRSPGIVTSMLGNLKCSSLEQRRLQARLGVFFEINKGLVDINPASFFHHSGPRTRGAQKRHEEQAQHHVFFHSLFPRTVSECNLLPTTISSAPSLIYYVLFIHKLLEEKGEPKRNLSEALLLTSLTPRLGQTGSPAK